jgi:protein-disulfide isomerase
MMDEGLMRYLSEIMRFGESALKMKRYLPFVIIAGVLVISMAAGMMVYRSSSQPETQPSNTSNVTSSTDFRHARGERNAPVTLEEFGDFQCPPCGALHPELKKIEAEYGPRLRVVFHNYPVISMHKHALAAAHAAEAAGLQGRFWEMHDMLYQNQLSWSPADDVRPVFIQYARDLNLDIERFTRDMDSPEVAARVRSDYERGSSQRVEGTPTLFINGRQMRPEAVTAEGLRLALDFMLGKKK